MQGCVLQSTVMWKEHLLTNAMLRVIVDRYVEGTPTYQRKAACYSRPLCGRNTYLPMCGCVLQSTVKWNEHLLTNAMQHVTVDSYMEGTPTYQFMAAYYSRPLSGRNTYLPMQGCVSQSTIM